MLGDCDTHALLSACPGTGKEGVNEGTAQPLPPVPAPPNPLPMNPQNPRLHARAPLRVVPALGQWCQGKEPRSPCTKERHLPPQTLQPLPLPCFPNPGIWPHADLSNLPPTLPLAPCDIIGEHDVTTLMSSSCGTVVVHL